MPYNLISFHLDAILCVANYFGGGAASVNGATLTVSRKSIFQRNTAGQSGGPPMVGGGAIYVGAGSLMEALHSTEFVDNR